MKVINMDSAIVMLILIGIGLLATMILLIMWVRSSYKPFRKMKDNELDDCYNLNNRKIYYNSSKKHK